MTCQRQHPENAAPVTEINPFLSSSIVFGSCPFHLENVFSFELCRDK